MIYPPVITIILLLGANHASILTDMERPVEVRTAVADEGAKGFLPCDVFSGNKDDISLILWFKDNASKPLYSIDVMGKPLSSASQWPDMSSLGGRSTFKDRHGQTGLVISNVTRQDEGIFRCRVDYKNSPTKNFKISLSVLVPPGSPVIKNSKGLIIRRHEVGPFEVGDTLSLSCEVSGGSPPPQLIWWREGTIFDDSYQNQEDDTTVNHMEYINLKREDLGRKFICQASNSNTTLPLSNEVEINLNLAPTELEILEKPTYVSEGQERQVTCRAVGGFPPPKIQWWIGQRQLYPNHQDAGYQGVATSVLNYIPVIGDDGRYLTCKVVGSVDKQLEDSWEIKVLYKPKVDLRLGKSLDPDNLRTGNDVYFECGVKANPIPHKLIWYHNGVEIKPDLSAGIILSTQSLVLQRVQRNASGEYSCQAVNSEGSSTSNFISLNILYPPVCLSGNGEPVKFSTELDKPVLINCQVAAFPQDVEFRWFFNNSDIEEWISPQSFQETGLSSSLQFVPKSSKDFGKLYCQAGNSAGEMVEPCVYEILPTGKPSTLTDCQVKNKTLSSMIIECTEGFDGGLPTNFFLQVYESDNLKLEFTNKVPLFEISQVGHASDLKIYIYAENAKGMSEPVVIDESMPGSSSHVVQMSNSKAVKISSSSREEGTESHLTVIISLAAGGCVLCTSLLVGVLLCGKKRSRSRRDAPREQKEYTEDGQNFNQEHYDEYQALRRSYESNPDVLPNQTYLCGTNGYNKKQVLSSFERESKEEGSQHLAPLSVISTSLPPPSGYGEPVCTTEKSSEFRSDPNSRERLTATLDRRRHHNPDPYPLYHTCTRKKRVTIVEHGQEESEV